MLIITTPIGAILWMVCFHIFWFTIHPFEIVYMGITQVPVIVKNEIPWLALAGFVGGILAGLFSLWYGKKINKDAETAQGSKEITS